MEVRILGCGGSDGVPLVGGSDGAGDWGDCDPSEPRNRRTRSSIMVSVRGTNLLIDTSPDLRGQLLANRIARVDAVLDTHAHADHCHGIHELRRLARIAGTAIPVYGSAPTLSDITDRFGYAFEGSTGGHYTPIADAHEIADRFWVDGIEIEAFEQDHGFGATTTGFRIGPMAYSTDVVDLPEESFACLDGIELWIVDCLQDAAHPTHANLETTLGWVARVAPRRAVLTHMNQRLDYRALRARCPPGVEPGYDGMRIEL